MSAVVTITGDKVHIVCFAISFNIDNNSRDNSSRFLS